LVLLEDDLGFFPPYYAAPIINNATLEKFPELEDVLNLLAGKITDEKMTQLNYNVTIDKQSVASVAKNFLTESGII
jgi:osmoprotectant transport system substrate-binding protein